MSKFKEDFAFLKPFLKPAMEEDYNTVGNSSSVLFLPDKVDILHNISVRAGLILVYSLIFSICIIGRRVFCGISAGRIENIKLI